MKKNKRTPKIRNDTRKRKPKKKIIINKKIKNAKSIISDSITFKSNLELYCYNALKNSNINFEYEKHKYILIPPFKYNDEKIRAATYTPDFVGIDWIIEIKGYATDVFKLKWKLFKKILNDNEQSTHLYLPRNKQQVDETINKIKLL